MLTQAPRGTKDVLPAESYRWQYLEAKMRAAAALAGYREVRTPVFEHTELFLRWRHLIWYSRKNKPLGGH